MSLPCHVPLLINNPWHIGQVGIWHEDRLRLTAVQDFWHVPLHQFFSRLSEVLEWDDVVVAHVKGIDVALGHLLLQLLVTEAKQLEKRVERG